jgi:hypothetical protein
VRSVRPRVLAATFVVVFAATPAGALAQPSGVAVRFDVEARAPCPGRAAFVERVRARTGRFHEAQDGEIASVYRVTLVDGAAATGRVECTTPDGSTTARDLGGGTCSEVADALALVVALGIDAEGTSTAPSGASSAPDAGAATLAEVEPTPSASPAPAPAPPPHAETPVRDTSRAAARWTLSTGGGLSVSTGAAPGPAFGPRIFIEAAGAGARASGVSAVADAELGLEGATTEASAGGQTARFAWITATIDVCPLRATLGHFEASTCVGGEAGAVDANASDHTTRPWFAAAGRLSLRWSPAGPLFVRIDGGAALAVVRDTFVFHDSPVPVYAVPAVGARGAAVLGARFW